jgi:hypothetical protein
MYHKQINFCDTFTKKMSMRYTLILVIASFLFLTPSRLKAQAIISWDRLADVRFDLVWFEEYQTKFMVPKFGETVHALKNKKVKIKGYVIPVDATDNIYVISKVPMAMCFFCGGSGSETIVELEMKKGLNKRYETDEIKTFQGTLTLNSKDVMHFIYILKDAEEVSSKADVQK